MGCGTTVFVSVASGYSAREIERTCGRQYGGETLLCGNCEYAQEQRYPQGWRYVPGDLCRHGSYVGSDSGPDYMCGACEMGDG